MLPTKAEFKKTVARLNSDEQKAIDKRVQTTLEKCAKMMRTGLMVGKSGTLTVAISSDPRVHTKVLEEFKKAGYNASIDVTTYESRAGGQDPRKARNVIERTKTILTVMLDDN